MDIDLLVERHLGETPQEYYENIRGEFDPYRLVRLFGRAITIYEVMKLLSQKASAAGLEINRDKLYAALMDKLKDQQLDGQISLKRMDTIDEELFYLVKKVIREKEDLFYEGEFRVIVPKILEESYTERFKNYYELRFVTEKGGAGAFYKAEEELKSNAAAASPQLKKAIHDGETISFVAAFYRHCVDFGAISAKNVFTMKISEVKLVDRLQKKYDLTDEETSALKYLLYKVISNIATKS